MSLVDNKTFRTRRLIYWSKLLETYDKKILLVQNIENSEEIGINLNVLILFY